MSYWGGVMNWPIDSDWKCEICEMQPPGSLRVPDDGARWANLGSPQR